MKTKVDWKTFGWVWPSEFEHPGHRTPTLAVSKEQIERVNWFFKYWCKFRAGKKYI